MRRGRLFVALLLALGACTHAPKTRPVAPPHAGAIDLLAHDWTCWDGAQSLNGSLALPAGTSVDSSGTHLEAGGAFDVAVRLAATGKGAASVVLIPDPAARAGRVRVTLADGRARVQGTDLGPAPHEADLSLHVERTKIVVTRTNRAPVTIAARDLFVSGRVYFGAEVAPGATLLIERLRTSGAAVVDPVAAVPALGALAETRGKAFGTAAGIAGLRDDCTYRAVLARAYNSVTTEGGMLYFARVHPARDTYAFANADRLVAFARAHHMTVHGHPLLWYKLLPPWLEGGSLGDAEVASIMRDHIRTVVGHFRGEIAEWDVVNEPLASTGARMRESVWSRAMGDAYIDTAFRLAHDADPGALLYLNEQGVERPGARADAFYDLVRGMVARGVPIDGVGLQMHEDLGAKDTPGAADVKRTMARFAALGLRVRISEMDVDLHKHAGASARAAQAKLFADVLSACLGAPNCSGFTTWGFTDRYSWLAQRDGTATSDGVPFDAGYAPKAAVRAMLQALSR
jgi:endo-1,4-beta-xylanase